MIGVDTIKHYLHKRKYQKRWRNNNKHNRTEVDRWFDQSRVSVGRETYGCLDVHTGPGDTILSIGSFCSIGGGVSFLLSVEHPIDRFSTFPFSTYILGGEYEAESKGDIIVNDDVWFGERSMIMSGVHIGQGAVIAAGAVVTKDVPPYAIVGGVPAKVIKYRFSKDIIDELLLIDFDSLTSDFIKKNIAKLQKRIENNTDLEWLPRKEL